MMRKIVTVELSDETFASMEKAAKVTGSSVDRVAAGTLELHFAPKKESMTEAEKANARAQFERHFGSVDLGYPLGIDNEQIDADLVREYGSTHEDE
jgi:hypothetical protein